MANSHGHQVEADLKATRIGVSPELDLASLIQQAFDERTDADED